MKKKKGMMVILSGTIAFFLLVMPVLAATAVVAVPVEAIANFFRDIGNFLFGGPEENDALTIMEMFVNSEDGITEINQYYDPAISEYAGKVDIPLNWIIVPNLLASVSSQDTAYGEPSPHDLKSIIQNQLDDLIEVTEKEEQDPDDEEKKILVKHYSLINIDEYLSKLKQRSPYNTAFQSITTGTIKGYIQALNVNSKAPNLSEDFIANYGDGFIYPLPRKAIVTSEYGWRFLRNVNGMKDGKNFHSGIDLAYAGGNAVTCGVPIYSVSDGIVLNSDKDTHLKRLSYGANFGIIQTSSGLTIKYWHLRDPFPLSVGAKVKKGQWIGYIGNTGFSSGCHLHLGIDRLGQSVNPRQYIDFNNPILPNKKGDE